VIAAILNTSLAPRSKCRGMTPGAVFLALVVGLAACATCPHEPTSASAAPVPPAALAGTRWRLVEIQSMDDTIGTTRPADRSRYTLDLGADGTATMRLDCNRATGRWSATSVADSASGAFRMGPLAMTRAMCPPPSLDTRIARDMASVRSYLLKDGRLHLSLMADGGIYTWEPDPTAE
jgi:heat shock protein HslJ